MTTNRKKIHGESRGKVSAIIPSKRGGQKIKTTLYIDGVGQFIVVKGRRLSVIKSQTRKAYLVNGVS